MNKSGTSSQVISLPKGGGALHGIGETFSPDLHTGTGNFTVPIALPNTSAMRDLFQKEEIEDILFVITYASRTPEWPV